ncbi:tyrosine-type recombinase/integrase [Ammonifex thiophilus]|uniref:Integrase n=1 Tax=Ammonifex thiophilus TaxID=444093 RepID=A0A3D8P246_9THEO|nr:tyrosine-type recombinase/integrase [Ammonifex thiophilus]RDV80744.1 integrase [Ammonifex thiophilus]
MQLEEALKAFKQSCLSRGLSPGTAEVYLGHVKRFFEWLGDPDMAEVTPFDVSSYGRCLREKGRKPATVNNALNALSSFFSWAKEAGFVSSDPTEGVRQVPEDRLAPRWLGRRELGRFLRAVQKHGTPRDRALVALLLHAGLRVSEAVSLRLEDVVIRERSGSVRVRGKGGKFREVPLNATARRVLKEYLAELPPQEGGWLFPGKDGKHLTRFAVEKLFARLSRLAGVEVTPHRLRHTFCKWLVDAGESLDRVACLAGHSNLNTTARYTRPGMEDLERAVEKLSWE